MNGVFGIYASKQFGEVWTPKQQKFVVGRDVAKMTSSTVVESNKKNTVVIEDDTQKIRNSMSEIFNAAKTNAQNGFTNPAFSKKSNFEILPQTSQVLYAKNGTSVELHNENGKKFLLISGLDDAEPRKIELTTDTRLSLDKNGQIDVHTGASALTDGVLKATGKNDILIRFSNADVQAGENTTVLNFGKGGEFSGGTNVTYLGNYTASTITAGKGSVNFAGYFEGSKINATEALANFTGVFESSEIASGAAGDRFSGYFSHSNINSGDGKNIFTGLFLQESKIDSGKDSDTYTGRFVDSFVNSGAGDDIFGNFVNVDDGYLVADYLSTVIDAGAGKDTFNAIAESSTINLGEGDDELRGVFTSTSVLAGKGNDLLAAMYSLGSSFDGAEGDDFIALGTAEGSSAITGEGYNTVEMGIDSSQRNSHELFGGGASLDSSRWITAGAYAEAAQGMDLELGLELQSKEFGSQSSNTVDAELGNNHVVVRDGKSEHIVSVFDAESSEEKAENEETKKSQPLETQVALASNEMQKAIERYVFVQSRPLGDSNANDKKITNKELAVTVNTGASDPLHFYSDSKVGLSIDIAAEKSFLERLA